MSNKEWVFHSKYMGCVIEYREGMLRRGWVSRYKNWHHDGRIGSRIHHSLENAHDYIDKLHRDLGDDIAID